MVKKTRGGEHLFAGGIAGMVARTCIAPIERIKILYQINSAKTSDGRGVLAFVRSIHNEGGLLGFWKGNTPAIFRVAPYMATTFFAYEEYKGLLKHIRGLNDVSKNLCSGGLAGITAVSLTYPLDVVRARLAMQSEGLLKGKPYQGMLDALRKIPKEEGIRALYRGMGATNVGVGPYAGIKFASYEALKKWMSTCLGVDERDLPASARVVSGAVAGATAQTFVYPLDVVRRRMQTGVKQYSGAFAALRTIALEEGISRGLYRGLTLNYLKTLPNVAIYMALYDVLKTSVFGERT